MNIIKTTRAAASSIEINKIHKTLGFEYKNDYLFGIYICVELFGTYACIE